MTRSRIKLFVGQATEPDAIEASVNDWLATNHSIELQTIETSATDNGTVVMTVWFRAPASR